MSHCDNSRHARDGLDSARLATLAAGCMAGLILAATVPICMVLAGLAAMEGG